MGLGSTLTERYTYNPLTGDILNSKGDSLGSKTEKGYYRLRSRIKGKPFSVFNHRLAWFLYHGEWPDGEMDHINGDKADNRLENLRVVDSSTNKKNRPIQSNNKSGYNGICWNKRLNKWHVQINIEPKKIKFLGVYEDIEDAIKVRQEWEKELEYHTNHGRKNDRHIT